MMPDAQNPFFYFLGFCYGIPPAVHEAGCRISFGICVIPAERQTAGAPQWCHMPCCHFVKSLSDTCSSSRRAPALAQGAGWQQHCPKPTAALWARGTPAPASASTLAELSAKGPDSYSKPRADGFTEMGRCP